MTALNGLVLGALVRAFPIAASPQLDEGAGLSDEQLATLLGFTMVGLRFEPARIEARVDETVAVRHTNRDGVRHAFDLDSFDVHLPVPSGRTGVVLFTPTKPGTYVFYCGAGDHRAWGMVGTPIVAP